MQSSPQLRWGVDRIKQGNAQAHKRIGLRPLFQAVVPPEFGSAGTFGYILLGRLIFHA